jgi:hypothetical protein
MPEGAFPIMPAGSKDTGKDKPSQEPSDKKDKEK